MLDVHSTHFTGARSDGLVEDYHGVHLIFGAPSAAASPTGVEPHVVEVGRLHRPGRLGAAAGGARPRPAPPLRDTRLTEVGRGPTRLARMVQPGSPETVFTYGAPQLKFGAGASDEIGFDLTTYGVRRVLVITDPGVAATGHPQRITEQVAAAGIEAVLFDRAHVEPTDVSLRRGGRVRPRRRAVGRVRRGRRRVGDRHRQGRQPAEHQPRRRCSTTSTPRSGRAAPRSTRSRPLVAVPTTTGTGSESTTVCVLDVLEQHVKSGISHPRLRPTLAVVDPRLTLTQPAGVTAASGMDILCHALESWTARPLRLLRPQDARAAGALLRRQPDRRTCGRRRR